MSDSIQGIQTGHHSAQKNHHLQAMVGGQGASQTASRQQVNAKKNTTSGVSSITDNASLTPELQELLANDPTLAQEAQTDPQILSILQNLSSGQLQQIQQNPSQADQIIF